MTNCKDERSLVEKLRQLAKWYNLSNPYTHQVLLDAADEIENLQSELSELQGDVRSVFGFK